MIDRSPGPLPVADTTAHVVEQARLLALPPFDVVDVVDPPPTSLDDRLRFADLNTSIVVVLHERLVVEHRVDFRDGLLARSTTQVVEVARPEEHQPDGRDVVVGLGWSSALRWRAGCLPIAEAVATNGFFAGSFPSLALGEGLVQRPSFRAVFPRLGADELEVGLALVATIDARRVVRRAGVSAR